MKSISKEQIADIAYGLYQEEWLREHISTERLLDTRRDFSLTKLMGNYDERYGFESFLSDVGFDGELYASFDEFFDNEFEDKAYMHELLKLPELIKAYDSYKDEENAYVVYDNLNPRERDMLYRMLWKDKVVEDIKAYATYNGDKAPTPEDIDVAADLYVNGEYDCNEDYWTNLDNVLEKAMGGEF